MYGNGLFRPDAPCLFRQSGQADKQGVKEDFASFDAELMLESSHHLKAFISQGVFCRFQKLLCSAVQRGDELQVYRCPHLSGRHEALFGAAQLQQMTSAGAGQFNGFAEDPFRPGAYDAAPAGFPQCSHCCPEAEQRAFPDRGRAEKERVQRAADGNITVLFRQRLQRHDFFRDVPEFRVPAGTGEPLKQVTAESGFTVDAVVFLRGTQGIKGAPEQLAHGMFCCVHGDTFRKKEDRCDTALSATGCGAARSSGIGCPVMMLYILRPEML